MVWDCDLTIYASHVTGIICVYHYGQFVKIESYFLPRLALNCGFPSSWDYRYIPPWLCICILTMTHHMRSGVELSTCGIMSTLKRVHILEYFRFLNRDIQPVLPSYQQHLRVFFPSISTDTWYDLFLLVCLFVKWYIIT
jgi:hypothetical protein